MVTYGTDAKKVAAREGLATVTIGGNTYALAYLLDIRFGYRNIQEDALGTENPLMSAGHFRGRITIGRFYSTDINLKSLITPSAGVIPETTITYALKDQDVPTTVTWTVKARLNEIHHAVRMGSIVVAEVSGDLTEIPTVA